MSQIKILFRMAQMAVAYNTVVHFLIILWGVPYNPRFNHVLVSLPFGVERLSLWHYLVILICKNFLKKVDI